MYPSAVQAVRIAYQGNRPVHRVVTLEGEVIDTAGTMAGGGGKPLRGAMRLSAGGGGGGGNSSGDVDMSPEEADAAQQELKDTEQRLQRVRSELAQLEKEVRQHLWFSVSLGAPYILHCIDATAAAHGGQAGEHHGGN